MDSVLIIDDDPRNVFALSALLRAKGYSCLTATGAEEGLDLLKSRNDISTVLMDIMMPDVDGYTAIQSIRGDAAISHIPVIAVTAQAMPGDKERCLAAGAYAYISKPIDVDVLVQLLAIHKRT